MTEGGIGAKLHPQLCAGYRYPHELQKARALNSLGRGLDAAVPLGCLHQQLGCLHSGIAVLVAFGQREDERAGLGERLELRSIAHDDRAPVFICLG